MRPRSTGFTLVELLVVITIIVVLLTLLTPAMDRAIYQAELTACGAKLHGMGTALTTGAVERQRRYPKRFSSPTTNSIPMALDLAGMNARQAIAEYTGNVNGLFNCPLAAEVDLEGTSPGVTTVGSYALRFDWQWVTGGGRRSTRIGDPVEYDGQKYPLLAQDYDLVAESWSTPSLFNSHPDKTQTLVPYIVDETKGGHQTWSAWAGQPPRRGEVDNNVMYQDLSVERFNSIKNSGGGIGTQDERFDPVPYWRSGASMVTLRLFLPRGR